MSPTGRRVMAGWRSAPDAADPCAPVMFTVCPKCALTLVVTAADLRVAQGYVRCGRCSSVFNALARLTEERGGASLPAAEAVAALERAAAQAEAAATPAQEPAAEAAAASERAGAAPARRGRVTPRRGARVQSGDHGCELGVRAADAGSAVDCGHRFVQGTDRRQRRAGAARAGCGRAGRRGNRRRVLRLDARARKAPRRSPSPCPSQRPRMRRRRAAARRRRGKAAPARSAGTRARGPRPGNPGPQDTRTRVRPRGCRWRRSHPQGGVLRGGPGRAGTRGRGRSDADRAAARPARAPARARLVTGCAGRAAAARRAGREPLP